MQIPWIAYAIVTTQFGFVPGCAVSAAVQIRSYLHRDGSIRATSPVRSGSVDAHVVAMGEGLRQLGPRAESAFAEDAAEVMLDGLGAEEQCRRDLSVRQALGKQYRS